MKRMVLAVLLALVPFMAQVPAAAAASDDWCDLDPVVVITTPAGNLVPVFNTNGAKGLLHQPTLLTTRVSYTVTPTNGGAATLVKMTVTVPNDAFGTGYPVRTTISTGPWGTLRVLAANTGISGKAMALQFQVDVP